MIGAGGLGHVAIQMLRGLSGTQVIAADIDDEKLGLATDVGAHHAVKSDASAAEKIREITSGLGVNAVFDFVGAEPTVELAAAVAAVEGDVSIVGIGGGHLPVGFGSTAYDVDVRAPYWGSRSELIEVLDMARAGLLHVEVETYSLDDAPTAYQRLSDGKVRGRAVIVPDSK